MVRFALVTFVVVWTVVLPAQQFQMVGVIQDGWEYAEIKHPRPTSEFMKYSPDWVHKEIFVGSILRTTKGYNSRFDLLFKDGSRVFMLPNTRMKVEMEKGLIVLNLPVGELHITSGGRLRVKTPEGYLDSSKGTKFRVRLGAEGREASYSVTEGELVVNNRLGVVFTLAKGGKAELKYDAEEDAYTFVVARDAESKVKVSGKDMEVEEGPGASILLLGDGGFEIEEHGSPIEESVKLLPSGELKVRFGYFVVFFGTDYEAEQNYNYYRGGQDSFELPKAELALEGSWRDYMRVYLSVDGVKDGLLNSAYFELFPSNQSEHFCFRFGQFRVPFGLEPQAPLSELLFLDRSFLTDFAFCGLQAAPDSTDLDLRYDTGLGIFGYLMGEKGGEGFAMDYALGLFNGSGRNNAENDSHKTFCGRVGFRLAKWLTVGCSYYDGSTDTGTEEFSRRRRGADLLLGLKDGFNITFEYIHAKDNPRVGKHGNDTEAFYIQTNIPLSFLGKSLRKLAIICRYEVFNPAYNSIPGITRDEWEKVTALCVGFRWDVSEKVALLMLYEKLDQGEVRYPFGFDTAEANEVLKFALSLKCW